MENSICLPLPQFVKECEVKTRSFIVFDTGSREVSAYPFDQKTIDDINSARHIALLLGVHEAKWCATLYFPESWPPDVIEDVLDEKTCSIDSGIHLPIWQRLDCEYVVTRCFVTYMDGYKEIPYEPFTYDHVAEMMAQTRDIEKLYEYEPSWCLVLWFPGIWLPSEIDEYLRSPIYQASLFES